MVNRCSVPEEQAVEFRRDLERARVALSERPGHLSSAIGRNVDDPTLWALVTTWEHVGAYRRALSAYDVKVEAWPTLGRALDEPTAYEVMTPGERPNQARPRTT